MILQGQIGPFSMPDILQFLALTKQTGQLVLDTGQEKAWMYFHKGELIYARREGPTERLGDRLLRLGLVTESQIAGANLRASIAPAKKRIGQILVEAGSLDQGTLQQVVKDQIREYVTEIIAFARGEFRFYAKKMPHDEDVLLDVSLDLLLLEGLKKLDELGKGQAETGDAGIA